MIQAQRLITSGPFLFSGRFLTGRFNGPLSPNFREGRQCGMLRVPFGAQASTSAVFGAVWWAVGTAFFAVDRSAGFCETLQVGGFGRFGWGGAGRIDT